MFDDELHAAARADTSPDRLAELARHESRTVRRAVAANANTPLETLEHLAHFFAEEVCGNPALRVMLVDDPDLFGRLDEHCLASLAHAKACPRALTEWAVRSVRRTGRCPYALVEALIVRDDIGREERRLLYGSGKLHWMGDLEQRMRAVDPEVVELFQRARTGEVTIDEMSYLATLSQQGCKLVAMRPDAPPELLARMAQSSAIAHEVLVIVAEHDSLPEDAHRVLARHGDANVRSAAALHPKAPSDVLLTLAADSVPWVRRGVARNPNTPAALLDQLASDPDEGVRLGVQARR